MKSLIFTSDADTFIPSIMRSEDGGQFKEFTLIENDSKVIENEDADNGMYIRICSWMTIENGEVPEHEQFNKLIGKKIKVTLTIED